LRLQEGYLSKELKEIRQQLLDVIVNLEAVIDYPEEDIEDVTYKKMEGSITEALKRVEKLLANGHAGRILREGLRTVIVGKPNVGKSSLLNQLLREDRALVSAYAGTTRDVIEEQLVVDGIPLVLADTAGIHATEDFVEQLGIKRSRELLAKAQLAIVVIDGTEALTEADQEILAAVQGHPYVVILNKADLVAGSAAQEVVQAYPEATILKLSAKTGTGLEEFRKWLGKFVYGSSGTMGDGLYVENLRQENLLRQAKDSLQSAAEGASSHIAYDCLSIDINDALENMGEITGQTASDEIISQIFARFCVGK
jgi:tRNA modification GTPase